MARIAQQQNSMSNRLTTRTEKELNCIHVESSNTVSSKTRLLSACDLSFKTSYPYRVQNRRWNACTNGRVHMNHRRAVPQGMYT